MIIKHLMGNSHTGYIAGTQDGIVTVHGEPARRDLIVFDAQDLTVVMRLHSLANGHYLINNLDPNKRYLIMCRPIFGLDDIGVNTVVWDFVLPMNDLTLDEQNELWQQMNLNLP